MFHVLKITLKQTLLIRVLQKNRTNRRLRSGYVSMEREKDRKNRFIVRNWLMQLWGLASLKYARMVVQEAEDPKKS